jgi:predicted DNA-binding transcriptional regulator AlpA
MSDRFIGTNEVIRQTAMCKSLVFMNIKNGTFHPVKRGRKLIFSENEIQQFIEAEKASRKSKPKAPAHADSSPWPQLEDA